MIGHAGRSHPAHRCPLCGGYQALRRDADVITVAFREFSAKKLEKEKKTSIRKELDQTKQQDKARHRQRHKVKVKDRGSRFLQFLRPYLQNTSICLQIYTILANKISRHEKKALNTE